MTFFPNLDQKIIAIMGHQEEGIEDQIITTNANDSDTNTLVPSHSEQVNDFFKHLCEIQVKNSVKLNHFEAFFFTIFFLPVDDD